MTTTLQKAMDDLIRVFHSYSGKEGDKRKLSKAELKNLIKGELPQLLELVRKSLKATGRLTGMKQVYLIVKTLIAWKKMSLICNIFFQGNKESKVVDEIMIDLDENKDGEVDFQEFVFMIAALTAACNDLEQEAD